MTDPTNDEIRDLLGRVMSDAPEPRAWAEVEQRARQHNAPPPVRRRTGIWLAAAACVVALVGGLAVVVGSDSDSRVPTDDAPATSVVPDTTHSPATTEAPDISEPTTVPEDDGVSDIPAEWVPLGDLNREGLRPLATLSPVDGDIVIPTAPTKWFLPPIVSIYPDPGDERPRQAFDVVTTPSSGGQPTEMIRVGVIPICARNDTDCAANTMELPPAPGSGAATDVDGNAWRGGEFNSVLAVFGDYFVQIEGGRYKSVVLLEDPAIVEFIEGLRVGSAADLPEQVVMFDEGTNTPISRTAENSDESADVPGSNYVPLGNIDGDGLRPLDTLTPEDGDIVIPTAPATWSLAPVVNVHPDDDQPGYNFVVVTSPASADRVTKTLKVGVTPICNGTEPDCGANSVEFPAAPILDGLVEVGGNEWGEETGCCPTATAVFGDFFIEILDWPPTPGRSLLDDPAIVEFIQGLRVGSLADLPAQTTAFDSVARTPIDRTGGEGP